MVRLFAITILATTLISCDEPILPPEPVKISARPGTAVVIPVDAPVRGKPVEAMGYIPAFPRLDPAPLPQNVRLLRHTLGLLGNGRVVGSVLIEVPSTAQGEITFTISATGNGSAMGGRSVFFSAQDTPATITVEGAPVTEDAPDLSGDWQADKDIWSFYPAPSRMLEIRYATGEKKTVRYLALPGADGRWFLIDTNIEGNTYWIDIDASTGTIQVAHPGGDYDPYVMLKRQ
ncbi:MAG: hypothetical protein ACE363_07415 [Alphaproteobacteria bacterium]